MTSLPIQWCETSFGSISDIQLGKMLDKAKNRGTPTPYLRNVNVRWGFVDISDVLTMPMTEEERSKYRIEDGDVLVCEGGEPGRSAVWRSGPTPFRFQKAILRVRAGAAVSPDWLVHYLRSASRDGTLSERFSGTTIKHLPREALQGTLLPLAPIEEQRRIVAKIDSLSTKSKRARDHLEHLPRLARKFRSVLLDRVFEKNDGAHFTLEELTNRNSPIRYGILQPGAIRDIGVPLIRVCDLETGEIDWRNLRRVSAEIDRQYAGARVEVGDVLLTVVGTIGRVGLVRNLPERTNIARAVSRLRPDQSRVVPEWLMWRLRSSDCQYYFLNEAREVARKTLNIKQVKNLSITVPSLQDQIRNVETIKKAVNWIDRLVTEAAGARKLIDHLDQTVLSKAFRGELVSQDPNDEPASILLERIKIERAGTSSPSRKRGRPKAVLA